MSESLTLFPAMHQHRFGAQILFIRDNDDRATERDDCVARPAPTAKVSCPDDPFLGRYSGP